MDYAAALRAAPSGPAVRLDTTPAAKAPVQKAPTPKPVKVEIEEPVHVVEEETAPTITLASVPAKPPTNRGLSPIVKFVVSVPPASTAAKDAPSSDANAADSDSSSEDGDAEATDEANANGAKSSKAASSEPKNHIYSAQDLENSFARLSDLVSLLERHAEDRHFELEGGFRFSRGNKNASGRGGASAIHELDLPTVTVSLKWLSAIIELLRNKTSANIAAGKGAFVAVARVEDQIRVIRIQSSQASKEIWLQFDDVVLDMREQAKLYLDVANRIEQILEKREQSLPADKPRKDASQKRRAISSLLHTAAFTSMLHTLQGLLSSSTEFPSLSKKFQEQEAHLAQLRRRLKEENQDMNNILFAVVPQTLLESNFQHIVARLEPPPSENAEAPAAASPAPAESSSSHAAEAPAKEKKLSKKEQKAAEDAAKAAEAERKRKADADAEAARKASEQTRREKQEALMSAAEREKRQKLVDNPFAHLENADDDFVERMEEEAEKARQRQVRASVEGRAKEDKRRAEEKLRLAQAEAEDAKNRQNKIAIAAAEERRRAAAEEAKRANEEAKRAEQRTKEQKNKADARSAEDKRKSEAAKAEKDRAAAEEKRAKKAAEKAERAAAEKLAAENKKKEAEKQAQDKKESKQQKNANTKNAKAEQIEHQQREKQRGKELKQIAARNSKKGQDFTLYYVGGAAVVVLVVAFLLYTKLQTPTL